MARQRWLSTCSWVTSLLPFPSVLYPNLAELESYMGLSLSSQEVQQSLPQMPEGDCVSICLPTNSGSERPEPPSSWSCLFLCLNLLSPLRSYLWCCFLVALFILRLHEKHSGVSWFHVIVAL